MRSINAFFVNREKVIHQRFPNFFFLFSSDVIILWYFTGKWTFPLLFFHRWPFMWRNLPISVAANCPAFSSVDRPARPGSLFLNQTGCLEPAALTGRAHARPCAGPWCPRTACRGRRLTSRSLSSTPLWWGCCWWPTMRCGTFISCSNLW